MIFYVGFVNLEFGLMVFNLSSSEFVGVRRSSSEFVGNVFLMWFNVF